MDVKKRLLRRPVRTLLWQVMLIAMSLLLGVSAVLVYASRSLTDVLNQSQTTIAVQQLNIQQIGPSQWVNYPVELFQSDIDTLKSLDMVKDIDLRTLTGAYIPALSARLGLSTAANGMVRDVDSFSNWDANTDYRKVILAGTVEQTWMVSDYSAMAYNLADVGGPDQAEGYSCRALLNIEAVISAHEDYRFFPGEGTSAYNGKVIVQYPCFYSEGEPGFDESFFQVGRTYVVRGEFDPELYKLDGDPDSVPFCPRLTAGMIGLQGSIAALAEEGQLVLYTEIATERDEGSGVDTIRSLDGERRILAEEVETTVEALTGTQRWQDVITLYDRTLHAFPVLGTRYLESMYCFVENQASIVSGRAFTPEEYDSGEKVCIISESVANRAGIQVGAQLLVSQFLVAEDYASGNESLDFGVDGFLNNPGIGYEPMPYGLATQEEAFTVVGIYRLENEWENSAYSISPNTIFMPQSAQLPGGFGGPSCQEEKMGTWQTKAPDSDIWVTETGLQLQTVTNGVQGVYLSIVLENGEMSAFEAAIESSDYADRLFLTFDQGYEAAMESIQALIAMANRVLAFAFAGWLLLAMLYLLLGQGAERRNLGIMRSVGAKPAQARRYLFSGGFLPAAMGVGVGTVLSNTVAQTVQGKLVRLTLTQAQSSVHSGGMPLDNGALEEMLAQSTLSVRGMLLLALVQLCVLGLVLWLHSGYLSRKKPRSLLGV